MLGLTEGSVLGVSEKGAREAKSMEIGTNKGTRSKMEKFMRSEFNFQLKIKDG